MTDDLDEEAIQRADEELDAHMGRVRRARDATRPGEVLGRIVLFAGMAIAGLSIKVPPFSNLHGPGFTRAWQAIFVDAYIYPWLVLLLVGVFAVTGVKPIRLRNAGSALFLVGGAIMSLSTVLAYLTIRLPPGLGDVRTSWTFWLTLPASLIICFGALIASAATESPVPKGQEDFVNFMDHIDEVHKENAAAYRRSRVWRVRRYRARRASKNGLKAVWFGFPAAVEYLWGVTHFHGVHWPRVRLGLRRAPLSVLAALMATWTWLWVALWVAVGNGIAGGLLGGAVFGIAGHHYLKGSGFAFAFAGAIVGAVILFLLSLLAWIYLLTASTGGSALLVSLLSGLVFGLVLTLGTIMFERWILHFHGYRRLSRRERDILEPIVAEVAKKMRIRSAPPFLISDALDVGAWTYPHHVVVTRRLLVLSQAQTSGIIAHELAHWKRGDATAYLLVRSCAAPLAFITAVQFWLVRYGGQLIGFLALLFMWPAMVLARFLVGPVAGLESRRAEYACDRAAVDAGFGAGLLEALDELRILEPSRGGWDRAMAASHPPIELRIDRIEKRMKQPAPAIRIHTLADMVGGSNRAPAMAFGGAPGFIARPTDTVTSSPYASEVVEALTRAIAVLSAPLKTEDVECGWTSRKRHTVWEILAAQQADWHRGQVVDGSMLSQALEEQGLTHGELFRIIMASQEALKRWHWHAS